MQSYVTGSGKIVAAAADAAYARQLRDGKTVAAWNAIDGWHTVTPATVEAVEHTVRAILGSVGYRESNGEAWLGTRLQTILDICAAIKAQG